MLFNISIGKEDRRGRIDLLNAQQIWFGLEGFNSDVRNAWAKM
jgi:hypothetical protein